MNSPIIVSIQVGRPQLRVEPSGMTWSSAIFKQPVTGPVMLRSVNLEGDRQADLRAHGGPDKAVLAYAAAHYPLWQAELGLPEMVNGGFGENFTVSGQTEAEACVGDVYQAGGARVQISQPRTPCAKLARKWKLPDLPRRVVQTGRSGWYLRVLQEGMVAPGMELELLERPYPQWTVQRVSQVSDAVDDSAEAAVELAQCAALAATWRTWLAKVLRAAAVRNHGS